MPTEPQYRMGDYEMSIAVRARLHLPPVRLTQLARTVHCQCGASLLDSPLHYQTCIHLRGSTGRKRHDLVVQQIVQIAREQQVPVTVEERPLWFMSHSSTENAGRSIQSPSRLSTTSTPVRNAHEQRRARILSPRRRRKSSNATADSDTANSRQRPDLRFELPSTGYLSLLSDVMITHPGSGDTSDLHAAIAAERLKSNKYHHFVQPGQVAFTPFVLESSGAWGRQAERLLNKLLQQVSEDGEGESFGTKADYRRDAQARIAVALHKGNALMARQCVQMVSSECDVYAPPLPHRAGLARNVSRRLFGVGMM
jgi:hypothetical protein